MTQTHVRERHAANGDVIDLYFFCTRSCWLGSFDEDRIGPTTTTPLDRDGEHVPANGISAGGVTQPLDRMALAYEIHCAECGGLIASPWRPSPLLVGGVARPPLTANGTAEPHNVLADPELDAATAEHHVGNWSYEGGTLDDPITFRLDCWWSGKTDGPRAVVGYTLRANNDTIFADEDYKPAPGYSPDSDFAAADLLGFLSCKPGDTDAEFFANYTRDQLAFAEKHGEELSIWSQILEGVDDD
jgi:hypothetical protein